MIIAIIYLAVWIAAAITVYVLNVILPLNYFTVNFQGRLGNGNFSTLVTLGGSLGGVVITWALAQGYKHLIRRRLADPEGTSIARLDKLCRLANLRQETSALCDCVDAAGSFKSFAAAEWRYGSDIRGR